MTTYRHTANGDNLALALAPYLGMTNGIRSTCAGIARYANICHGAIMTVTNGARQRDLYLNPEPWEGYNKWLDTLAESVEAEADKLVDTSTDKLRELVSLLPDHDGGPWVMRTNRDRVFVVAYLVAPDGREIPLNK